LLVRDGVSRLDRRAGERNLIVLPGQIGNSEHAVGGELIERPLAVPLEFERPGTKLAAAGDGCNFREIELGIIGALEMGPAEICDLSAG
jgi:hypothetical protein